MVRKTLVAAFGVAAMALLPGCPADLINNMIPPIPIDIPEQKTTLADLWDGAKAADGTPDTIPAFP
ncbi:MAG: hypothetical protein FJZ01_21255, partial [Candidatus Sericytochromatia bacterium]|nr:hypothetical protein [Candidatus Tanganyikabacteria bacterium]